MTPALVCYKNESINRLVISFLLVNHETELVYRREIFCVGDCDELELEYLVQCGK